MILFRIKAVITFTCAFIIHGLATPVTQCGEGERLKNQQGVERICEPCDDGRYKTTLDDSPYCSECTTCDEESWSIRVSKCSRTRDTTCRCMEGFVKLMENSAMCACDTGSELIKDQPGLPPIHIDYSECPGPGRSACRECEDGFFTPKIGKRCKKWQECKKSGVKVKGTKKTDVICNDESDRSHMTHTPSPPTQTRSSMTQTENSGRPDQSSSPTIKPTRSPKGTEGPGNSNTDFIRILALIGVILLLPLIIVTYRLATTHCILKKKQGVKATQDSMCRRPVEESGDSKRSSLVKSISREP